MTSRTEIHEASIERMKALRPGDPVTNVSVGAENPLRYGRFVEYVVKERENIYGFTHRLHFARVRALNGRTRLTDIRVVHPGHLDDDTCKELFRPVWESQFGKRGES